MKIYTAVHRIRIILFLVLAALVVGATAIWLMKRGAVTVGNPFITELVDSSFSLPEKEQQILFYQSFIQQAHEFSQMITENELYLEIKEAQHYLDQHPEGRFTDDLGRTIQETLNIGFLLDGIEDRPLSVTTIAVREYEGYTEQELILDDPWVQQTRIYLLLPEGKHAKPLPAVIGLHGHADSANTFRDKYFGAELAQAGFVVLIPAVQTLEHPGMDELLSKELYLNGFTLMGTRVYKVQLFLKYLHHLAEVDNSRISLMGHSGGSSTALLVAHMSPSYINALVYDFDGAYLDMWSDDPHVIHCETIPRLAYYTPQIHDVSTLPFPARKFGYGYSEPRDKKDVIRFLQEASPQVF